MNDNRQTELVKRACEGDTTAFYEIVDQYKKKVYYIAYDICGDHHEAEDISQEVFIKVFKNINKFRLDAKLSTWIYQISVNTSIDAVRKHKKKQILMETSQMEALPPDTTTDGPEEKATGELLQQQVRDALPVLSKKERMAFVMRYFNELKLMEIAGIMDISINTIKTLLLRAKKKLRKQLVPGGAS